MRIPIQGFDAQKLINLQLEKIYVIDQKIPIYLSLGIHIGHPSYRRRLQPSTENIQHFKRSLFNTPSSVRPSDSSVTEDAGTEPRTGLLQV
jgi:hypothetical protein